ncbi:hypothetical protein [Kineococcus sp. G2]|uniref:hypothetical protein n=1 Tax=Kineococcus sp. G2 TaxID=3127484 RepID=UPI00301C10F5
MTTCTGAGGELLLRNVTVPTLTPHLPDPATRTGTGVVIAPGGALHVLAADHEGDLVAQRLAERGIAAFVLRYRLVPTPIDEAALAAAVRRLGDRATSRRCRGSGGRTPWPTAAPRCAWCAGTPPRGRWTRTGWVCPASPPARSTRRGGARCGRPAVPPGRPGRLSA